MSEKKYPTRMHEVLGVDENEDFIVSFPGDEEYQQADFECFVDDGGNFKYKKHPELPPSIHIINYAINHGITRRPRLTANHVLPYITSNSVGIDITGGCEYCKAGKGIMNHYGIDFYAFARIENGQFEMAYSNNIRGDGLVAGHKAVKINYCPMCGRKLEVEG